jgi:cytidyltransferase-like protein
MGNSRKNHSKLLLSRPRLFEEMVEDFLKAVEIAIGLRIGAPIPVEEIATDLLGYRVLTDDLRYHGEAIQGVIFPKERKILIDSSCGKARRRFVLAHEIGHVALEHSSNSAGFLAEWRTTLDVVSYRLIANRLPDSLETQANKFAAALLVPRHLLIPRLAQFPEVDVGVIRSLTGDFVVSPEVMINRLDDLAKGDLLYTLSDRELPRPLSVRMDSLPQLRNLARERSKARIIRRLPLQSQWRLGLGVAQPRPALVSHISSESGLVDFIVSLGDPDSVGVVVGGTPYFSVENKRRLESIKEVGKTVVIVCASQEHADYLSAFRPVDHIVIYTGQVSDEIPVLPSQLQNYVVAEAQPDRWTREQLARSQYESFQPSLLPRKRLNTKRDARLFIREKKDSGEKAVLVVGCFDLLHIGHVKFLQNAKKQNEVLVVGVENDKRVLHYKGRLINNIEDRCEVLEALSCVDYVFVISDLAKWQGAELYAHLCRSLRPNFWATGESDPQILEIRRAHIEAVNGSLRIVSYYNPDQSTTNNWAKWLQSEPEELRVWKATRGYLEYSKLISHWSNSGNVQITPALSQQLDLFQDDDSQPTLEMNLAT